MYLLGLRALGHEVFYIEDTGECVYDPVLNTRATDPAYGTTYIHHALAPMGLGDRWSFVNYDGTYHGRSADEVRTKVTSGAVGTAGSVLDFMTKTLPGNVSLHVPRGGMEDRLADYLGTASAAPTGRDFEFDRIGFETGSAVLTAASREQLRNIAAILGAYPQAHVTIAGYTDNVGAEPVNVDLSRTRADSVMHALREMGVAPDRMEARGYGSENPLASNDTEIIHADVTPERRVVAWLRGRRGSDAMVVVVANFSDWRSENPEDPATEYVVRGWPDTPAGRRWREVTQERDVPAEWAGREPLFPWEAKVYELI